MLLVPGRRGRGAHTPFDAFELASDAVARGHRKVFAEIGLQFGRYLHDCDAELGPDSAPFAAFLDGLHPGEPPGGQRYLRQAFARYQPQRFEPEPNRRAELEELLARFEPAGGALDDCGAEDWAQLTQRMHYIAHLFRAYHEIPALGSAPFTAAQLERIRAGVVPDGEL